MPKLNALICCLLALATPLAAQDTKSPRTWHLDGQIALSVTDRIDSKALGFVDATLTVPIGQGGTWAFEAGTYLFALEGKRPHETYGALVWDQRLRMGAIRPAYDFVLPSVFIGPAPYLAYRRAEFTRAFATVQAMRRTAVPWGLSYDGGTAALRWRVSAQAAQKGGFHAVSAAARYAGSGWSLMAAVEGVWSEAGAPLGTNAKLGTAFELGSGRLALAYLHPDANDHPDAMAFDLTVPVSAHLDLSAMGELSAEDGDSAYGLAVNLHARHGVDWRLAATSGSDGPAFHAGLTERF